MKTIKVKSPTRVDLAGGTLDLWPLFAFVGPCQTVNVAISIWTEAELTPSKDTKIHIISEDIKINMEFETKAELLSFPDSRLKMYQVVVEYFNPQYGFSLVTKSESPVGGGLGGSSSLMISMLKAFSTMCGKTWETVHDLVHVAHNLEAKILTTPTGTQDYYPAAMGGLNILEYSADGVTQEILSLRGTEVERSFLLIYTGRSHHSGLNNFEVLKSAVGRDSKVLGALADLKDVAGKMAKAVKSQNFDKMAELFRSEYQARVQLTAAFTSPEIEKLRLIAEQNQAIAKICGAGGGGCVLVWAPKNKNKVAEECQKAGFQVMKASLVDPL